MARPLVYACVGDSPEARLAGEVAAGLARLGLVERFRRPTRSRQPVVAVEGCRRGCGAAALRSRGVRVRAAVRLDELAAGGAAGEQLVRMAAATLGLAGPRLPSRYLRPLLELHPQAATAASLARGVGVTRVSAGEALATLSRYGLVERGPDKAFALTPAGLAAAREAVRRERIVECFLADFVGYPAAAVRDLAVPIADSLSAETAERLFQRLGAPARCPHGRAIGPPR